MPLLQAVAYYRSLALGIEPERPRHLGQVVMLDEKGLL